MKQPPCEDRRRVSILIALGAWIISASNTGF
jgi:hypothetical protein